MRQPTRRARQTATIRREREDQFNGWLADAMIAALHTFPFPFPFPLLQAARPQESPAPGRRSLPFRAGRPKHFCRWWRGVAACLCLQSKESQ